MRLLVLRKSRLNTWKKLPPHGVGQQEEQRRAYFSGAADNLVSFCRCRRQKVSLKFSMYRHVTDVAIILSDPLQLQFLRFGRAHVADERAGLGSIDGISRDNEAEHDRNLAYGQAGIHLRKLEKIQFIGKDRRQFAQAEMGRQGHDSLFAGERAFGVAADKRCHAADIAGAARRFDEIAAVQ